MQIFVIAVLLSTIVALPMSYLQLKRMRTELAYLPTGIKKGFSPLEAVHQLVGRNVLTFFSLPEELRGRPCIVMVASPSCSPCHRELEQFIGLGLHQSTPFVCYAIAGEQEDYDKFIRKYGSHVIILPISEQSLLEHLQVSIFPAIMLLNGKGIVKRVGRPLSKILQHLESA